MGAPPIPVPEVLRFDPDRRRNNRLMHDVWRLGYLNGPVLDPTYGFGKFWQGSGIPNLALIGNPRRSPSSPALRPDMMPPSDTEHPVRPPLLMLWASDVDLKRSPLGYSIDATHLPYADATFGTVVLDPPYKLNGRPDPFLDRRYGVHRRVRWQDRIALLLDIVAEGARVTRVGGHLLVKCQDQVCSGAVRWQTDEVARVAARYSCRKVDRLEVWGYRRQPPGRSQEHARATTSTLLVFRREGSGQAPLPWWNDA